MASHGLVATVDTTVAVVMSQNDFVLWATGFSPGLKQDRGPKLARMVIV